jgi:hypothetical protein
VQKLYQHHVTERDRVLLDLVFSSSLTQEKLDDGLGACDIEVMGAHKSLMLSYLRREHPELRFPAYAAPRLDGLITFYRFANMQTLQHFSRIGKALNAAGIPMLIFKGAAMKILRPELPRPMADVDILIPPERLDEAVRLCRNLGYHDSRSGAPHAVDIHTADGQAAVDIHHALFTPDDTSGPVAAAFHKRLLARACERCAFGVRVWLPAHEDLFFIVLANLSKNLRNKSSLHGLFYALLDCRFLLRNKPSFDWEIVRNNIQATNTEMQVQLAVGFMEALAPGLALDFRAHLPASKKMNDFCNQVVFDEDFLQQRREACRAILVLDLKNYPWHYGKMILKLLALKKLRQFPFLVRWYLRKRGLETGRAS